jgi:hypothetical protein
MSYEPESWMDEDNQMVVPEWLYSDAVKHLRDLVDWGHGEKAPDEAIKSWEDARRWLDAR